MLEKYNIKSIDEMWDDWFSVVCHECGLVGASGSYMTDGENILCEMCYEELEEKCVEELGGLS